MSAILVVLLVILSSTLVVFIFVHRATRWNRLKTEKMLRHFSELGTTYNLSFTGEEVLGNRIIGVDGLKGKIVFVEHSGTAPACFVIDLAEVESCRVSKIYRSANAKNQDAYLHSIALEFDVVRSGQTVALPFYNPVRDAMQDAAEREAKAKSWASVLLKMLVKERKRV